MELHVSQHAIPIQFRNDSGETMPPNGCGRLDAQLTPAPDGSPRFSLIKPDGQDGLYVVNWDHPVPDGKEGLCYLLKDAHRVLMADITPDLGDEIGPVEDEWAADTDGQGGLLFLDGPNPLGVANVCARTEPLRLRVVILTGLSGPSDVDAAPTTCTAAVLKRDSGTGLLTDSLRRITLTNHDPAVTDIADGTFGKAEWLNGIWELYWLSCGPSAAFTGLPVSPP